MVLPCQGSVNCPVVNSVESTLASQQPVGTDAEVSQEGLPARRMSSRKFRYQKLNA